ncbi:MAG: Sec-independent protein translocase subunit TatA [Kutzneria sp.]|nr:Sec-independent protein translocase subunit TatA [Kutzneria sp.]
MGEFSPWHLAIVALVFVVLFGSRKLPDVARGVGQSLRIFKAEMKADSSEEAKPAAASLPPATEPQAAPQPDARQSTTS